MKTMDRPEVSASSSDVPSRDRVGVLKHEADQHLTEGRYEAARSAYEAALPLAEGLGDTVLESSMWTSLAQAFQGLDRLDDALRASDRSLATSGGDPAVAARAFLTSARLHVYRGETAEARTRLTSALSLARSAGDQNRTAEALAFLGYLQTTSGHGQLQEGIESLHEAVTLQTALGNQVGLVMSYMLLGNGQVTLGDYAGARRSFTMASWLCEEVGNPTERGIALINLAIVALERGDPAEALSHAGEARRNADTLGNQFQRALSQALAAAASVPFGLFATARRDLDAALVLARELDNRYLEGLVLAQAVEVLLLLGYPAEAMTAGEALEALQGSTGNQESASRLYTRLAEAAWRLGDPEGSARLAARALERAQATQSRGDQARALQVTAWLAVQRGDWQPAVRPAETALGLARTLGARLLEAELLGLLGTIAHQLGQEATPHFEAMEAIARHAQAPWHRAEALWGQAETTRDLDRAPDLRAAARHQMAAITAGLDETARRCFLRYPERRCMLEAFDAPAHPQEEPR